MRLTAKAQKSSKQMSIQPVPLPAPVGGWDAISPLANMPIDRAVQLDNWVCRPGWIESRNGYVVQASGVGNSNTPVQTVMSYNNITGGRDLFGVAGGTIYNCSIAGQPAKATNVTGLGSSRLQHVIFANPATTDYLVTVNGTDNPWIYDGKSWTQPTITIGYATGSVTWSVNMVPNETLNLNGTVITFVALVTGSNQVEIQDNLADTLSALVSFLNASNDTNILEFTYSQALGNTLLITAQIQGYAGNSLTIAAGFAAGTITFALNPSNGDTITINGSVVQFVTTLSTVTVINQVQIGATLAATLANLLSFLSGTSISSLTALTYAVVGSVLQLTSVTGGVLGNAILISASAAVTSGISLSGGSTAAPSGTTLSGGGSDYGITSDEFVHVWSYMGRLWFVPNNSTNVVYLQTVNGISGSASIFPLGPLMQKGGYIMAIGSWTVDTRQQVDEYIAFITSRGEVFVYQGTDPTTATTFALTGRYQVGSPIGRRCFLRITGDLQILTVDGAIGMSEMLSTDRAAANRVSLTSIIMNQMNLAAQKYKDNFGWQLVDYPLATLVLINIPIVENGQQMQFVMNTITGAWSRFIGLNPEGTTDSSYGINANCWEVDAYDNIFFGGNDGTVYQWNIGSGDNSQPITCIVQTAYNNFGNGAQLKRYTLLQPLITTTGSPIPSIGINVDFNSTNLLSTAQPSSGSLPEWDQVNWNNFNWESYASTTNYWTSVDGLGHYVSVITQITTSPSITDPTYQTILQLNGWNILAESGAYV